MATFNEKELLTLLATNSPNPLMIFDKKGACRFANKEAEKQLPEGFELALVLENVDKEIEGLFSKNSTMTVHHTTEEQSFRVTLKGVSSLQCVLGYISDVTDEKRREKLLIERSNAIIDEYVLMLKTDIKGTVIEVSMALSALLSYRRDKLYLPIASAFKLLKVDHKMIVQMIDRLKTNGAYHGEVKCTSKKGKEIWLSINLEKSRDINGKHVGYTMVAEDITDKKIILAQEKQLVQQSRHAAMGEMIGMIAHQWRQPITAVSMSVGNIQTDLDLDDLNHDELQKALDLIAEQMQYLSKTIDDFRNFFKPNKQLELVRYHDLPNQHRSSVLKMR